MSSFFTPQREEPIMQAALLAQAAALQWAMTEWVLQDEANKRWLASQSVLLARQPLVVDTAQDALPEAQGVDSHHAAIPTHHDLSAATAVLATPLADHDDEPTQHASATPNPPSQVEHVTASAISHVASGTTAGPTHQAAIALPRSVADMGSAKRVVEAYRQAHDSAPFYTRWWHYVTPSFWRHRRLEAMVKAYDAVTVSINLATNPVAANPDITIAQTTIHPWQPVQTAINKALSASSWRSRLAKQLGVFARSTARVLQAGLIVPQPAETIPSSAGISGSPDMAPTLAASPTDLLLPPLSSSTLPLETSSAMPLASSTSSSEEAAMQPLYHAASQLLARSVSKLTQYGHQHHASQALITLLAGEDIDTVWQTQVRANYRQRLGESVHKTVGWLALDGYVTQQRELLHYGRLLAAINALRLQLDMPEPDEALIHDAAAQLGLILWEGVLLSHGGSHKLWQIHHRLIGELRLLCRSFSQHAQGALYELHQTLETLQQDMVVEKVSQKDAWGAFVFNIRLKPVYDDWRSLHYFMMKEQQRAFKQTQREGAKLAGEADAQAFQGLCRPLKRNLLDAMVFARTGAEAAQSRLAYKAAWQALVLWIADKQPKILVRLPPSQASSSSSSCRPHSALTEEELRISIEHFIKTDELAIVEAAKPYLRKLEPLRPTLFAGLNLDAPINVAKQRELLREMLKYYHTDHGGGNSEEDKRVAQEVVGIYGAAIDHIKFMSQERADILEQIYKDEEIARMKEETARIRAERILMAQELEQSMAAQNARMATLEQELESLKQENEHRQAVPVDQEEQKASALAQDREQLKQEEARRRSEELAARKQKVAELRGWREMWGKKTGLPSPLLFASTNESISPTTDENTPMAAPGTTPPSLPRVCATVFATPPQDTLTSPALSPSLASTLTHKPHNGF